MQPWLRHLHVAGPTYGLRSTLPFSSFDSSRVNSKGFSAYTSLRIHPNGRVRAGLEGELSGSQHKEGDNRPVLRRKKPAPSPSNTPLDAEEARSLETVLVEDEHVSLEGVGRVDREASSSSFSWGCDVDLELFSCFEEFPVFEVHECVVMTLCLVVDSGGQGFLLLVIWWCLSLSLVDIAMDSQA